MLRDLVAKGEVMRERMRRPGDDDDDEAARERSATDGMLLRDATEGARARVAGRSSESGRQRRTTG